MRRVCLLISTGLALAFVSCASSADTSSVTNSGEHEQEILAWRQRRVGTLRAPYGWLSLVGLHWLQEGENRFGSGSGNAIILPPGSGAGYAGSLWLEDGQVRVKAADGSGLTTDGEPVTSMVLRPDTGGAPTELALGSVRLYLIERSGKLAVRVKDSEAETQKNFRGIDYYPIDSAWRVTARFEPYDPPRMLPIVNVLGMPEPEDSPGALVFDADGETHRLDAIGEGESLFIVFGDATNGSETYGGGRFVYTDLPSDDGTVILDFNKSYNPPCVFTAYSTCPLPPEQNKLPIAVRSGERVYAKAPATNLN